MHVREESPPKVCSYNRDYYLSPLAQSLDTFRVKLELKRGGYIKKFSHFTNKQRNKQTKYIANQKNIVDN